MTSPTYPPAHTKPQRGRPKLGGRRRGVYLLEDDYNLALDLGSGSVTRGVRTAFRIARGYKEKS